MIHTDGRPTIAHRCDSCEQPTSHYPERREDAAWILRHIALERTLPKEDAKVLRTIASLIEDGKL